MNMRMFPSLSLLASMSVRTVGAFTRTPVQRFGLASRVATAQFSSAGPMPYDDEKMPFYALGLNLAQQVGGQANLKTLLSDEEIEIVLEAFSSHLRGTETTDARDVLIKYGNDLNKLLQERTSNIVDRVKSDGQDFIKGFIDCNDDAVKTDSGLVYLSMKEGEGKQPTVASTVEVHYHGTLTDGTVFDSSVDRGQTISFPLNGVIKGWQEGLAMMKEGGKATLVIPSDLAYGDAGSGGTIPPGATLKFEVELFKVS
uniref:peptidylprolyl isomerase n=1 Tax=Grammatophora oceanica TaxID=210454 RepID=A0A7S1Y640_9STRA|mmetsp:Transcript_29832/g.44031  ORF Transcript_29832/g.44031 Transcript_29832/m.44031 type:complete len:256 (+) Transcript_29832:33-800(+)